MYMNVDIYDIYLKNKLKVNTFLPGWIKGNLSGYPSENLDRTMKHVRVQNVARFFNEFDLSLSLSLIIDVFNKIWREIVLEGVFYTFLSLLNKLREATLYCITFDGCLKTALYNMCRQFRAYYQTYSYYILKSSSMRNNNYCA